MLKSGGAACGTKVRMPKASAASESFGVGRTHLERHVERSRDISLGKPITYCERVVSAALDMTFFFNSE
jgi:hypothetical protein